MTLGNKDSMTPPNSSPAQLRKSGRARLMSWGLLVIALGAIAWGAAGMGLKTWVLSRLIKGYGPPQPVVAYFPQPVNGERDVRTHAIFSLTVKVRNTKLDSKTLETAKAELAPAAGGASIPVVVKGAGEKLMILRPTAPLQPETRYKLSVSGMRTTGGVALPVFTEYFTTGRPPDPAIRFQKIALPETSGYGFTCVVVGPDHKLYAGTDEGIIFRYPILSDGRLGQPEKITSLQKANGGPRLLIGFCFDPAATADNPIIWASNGHYSFTDSPDFTGKLTRLSGPNLETVQDVLIHLPRASQDHMNNQPNFGPDGALYFGQGASNAYGAPDPIWHNRPEHLLTASVLRLDVSKVTPGHPLDTLTVDAGGPYDPRRPGAPLTVYAIGIRNAYDLVWTTKGQLYVPVNGASAGANSPAGPGVPALINIRETEDDWLFHVTPGPDAGHPNYYGHPNPQWNHFVLNGGNMTGGEGFAEISEYPLGTKPDPDWHPATYDFGPHVSADGIIEYLSDTFDGKLKHDLIVCRYNAGSDLIDLHLDDKGGVAYTQVGIPGFTNLDAPLDLTEDRTNGNIYVAEYGGRCITLMRPAPFASIASPDNAPVAPHAAPGSETPK